MEASGITPQGHTYPTLPAQDINGCRIHAYKPGDGSHATIDLDEPVGCVVPTSNPDFLLAATSRDIVEVDVLLRAAGQVLASTPAEHGVGERPRDCGTCWAPRQSKLAAWEGVMVMATALEGRLPPGVWS